MRIRIARAPPRSRPDRWVVCAGSPPPLPWENRLGVKGESPVAELVSGLKCRLCGKLYPKEALNFCTDDFGPLEVAYDYDAVARTLSRRAIESRPRTMWR